MCRLVLLSVGHWRPSRAFPQISPLGTGALCVYLTIKLFKNKGSERSKIFITFLIISLQFSVTYTLEVISTYFVCMVEAP